MNGNAKFQQIIEYIFARNHFLKFFSGQFSCAIFQQVTKVFVDIIKIETIQVTTSPGKLDDYWLTLN